MLLAVLLVGSISAGQLRPAQAAARADQGLLTLAAQQPTRTVSVIIRLAEQAGGIEQQIRTLGGRVTSDLSIIRSVVAELPAGAILTLAQDSTIFWISPDSTVTNSACLECISAANLTNTYIQAIQADKAWAQGYQGQGVGVAVVDSGVNFQTDLYTIMGRNRVVSGVAYNRGYNTTTFDAYSHGSHVAGIIGGNGRASNGKYIGVAPQVNIINVKVSDDLNNGAGTASSVVKGLQWILNNKAAYNIRVVNISINSDTSESYHVNPIDAAAEILWNNGIVVVTSSGNRGESAVYPPANDPFVITVGASDDKGTAAIGDDSVATFSAYGTTADGFSKPDLVAPGKNIVSLMGNMGMGLPAAHPRNVVDLTYFRMSGTSVSAPMVAAAAALLLQREPSLTPNQVKYRLKATANKGWPAYSVRTAGAGILDVYAALNTATTQSANANLAASRLITGDVSGTNQTSVNWTSVNWTSVNWTSVNWSSDYWGE
jgi:serine protease AprX